MFPHPTDCKKFYQCAQGNVPGKYRGYEIECPDGTAFDPSIMSCTWAEGVAQCKKNKPKRRFYTPPTPSSNRPSFRPASTKQPTKPTTKRTTPSQVEREEIR